MGHGLGLTLPADVSLGRQLVGPNLGILGLLKKLELLEQIFGVTSRSFVVVLGDFLLSIIQLTEQRRGN